MSDINVTVQDEIVNIDVIDTPVLVNVVNSPGQQGPAGPGVPVGGTAGQILAKASATDYDTAWINNYAKYLATNVRNQTGSTIGAFQVVYISGATGNKPLISLADADTEATSSKTYGVTATSIANNGTGDVVTAGELSGINTSAFNEGDLLWLSTTAGGVVTSPPAEPAHAVFIGYVVRSHPTLGTIDVSIQNGYELNELHGVQITSAANNQGLFYNSSNSLWENKSITTILGYTPEQPLTFNSPLSRAGNVVSIPQATGAVNGFLSATDWTTFNSKQAALGFTPANAATTLTINGVTFDLSANRSWTIAAGISGSGAAGQVTYWDATSAVSGSNNFTWDNAIGLLTVKSENSAAPVRGILNEQYNNGVQAAAMVFRKARGTIASPANVLASDLVGAFSFSARVGGAFTSDRALFGANMATSTGIGLYFIAGSTDGDYAPDLYIHPTGNVVVNGGGTIITGGVTDGGQKFQVYGDTLLRGSGNTSATTALTVQNSSSVNILRVLNDGQTILRGTTNNDTTNIFRIEQQNGNGRFLVNANGQTIIAGDAFTSSETFVSISRGNFNPTSGTATHTSLAITPTINQTGGANGITRGLYVNPTLTAAADFRAIETTAGNVLFGASGTGFFWDNTNSRLGIGTNAPSTTLDIRGKARIETTGTTELDMFGGGGNILRISCSSTTPFIGTLTNAPLGFFTSATERGRFTTNGNLMLGTTSDLGVRLGVVGDTILRGSGATSATTALTVQNSDGTNMLLVNNSGYYKLSGANGMFLSMFTTSGGTASISGTNTQFYNYTTTQAATSGAFLFTGDSFIQTSGSVHTIFINKSFTPTSGSASFSSLTIAPANINQTGGANGITRGIYIVPTLTAAADWRSIEWSNNTGWGLYGAGTANNYLGGNVAIGSTSNTTDWLNIAASTTAKAHIYLAAGVAPTSPANGDIWFDGTDIKMRIGGVTKTFTLI